MWCYRFVLFRTSFNACSMPGGGGGGGGVGVASTPQIYFVHFYQVQTLPAVRYNSNTL